MRYLIYDSVITGHHLEYIENILNSLSDLDKVDQNSYVFVLPEGVKISNSSIQDKIDNLKNVKIDFISDSDYVRMNGKNILARSFYEYNVVLRYAKKHSPDALVLMYFNIFQLALCFRRSPYNIIGILFLQFSRMELKSVSDKIKYYRKYWTTKIYSLNRKVKKVFVLNDQKTADFLNQEFNVDKFQRLIDPVPSFKPIKGFDVHSYYNIKKENRILLHIGSIDYRKGTIETIESLLFFDHSTLETTSILVVGKAVNSDVGNAVQRSIDDVKSKIPNASIIWDNKFVPNDLFRSLMEKCDVVLMPYKNPEASSGILGHAISCKKQVIMTGRGLLKELMEEYNNGVLLETVSPESIAEAINMLKEDDIDDDKIEHFKISHSAINFTKTLFDLRG